MSGHVVVNLPLRKLSRLRIDLLQVLSFKSKGVQSVSRSARERFLTWVEPTALTSLQRKFLRRPLTFVAWHQLLLMLRLINEISLKMTQSSKNVEKVFSTILIALTKQVWVRQIKTFFLSLSIRSSFYSLSDDDQSRSQRRLQRRLWLCSKEICWPLVLLIFRSMDEANGQGLDPSQFIEFLIYTKQHEKKKFCSALQLDDFSMNLSPYFAMFTKLLLQMWM